MRSLCRNDRTEAARRTCRCLLQSRMTRLSRRRRHNFRKNAVRDAENIRLTPMPQISGWKAHPAIFQPEALQADLIVRIRSRKCRFRRSTAMRAALFYRESARADASSR